LVGMAPVFASDGFFAASLYYPYEYRDEGSSRRACCRR
jgi:hypothetical protein